jgi:hypothetical protein
MSKYDLTIGDPGDPLGPEYDFLPLGLARVNIFHSGKGLITLYFKHVSSFGSF